MPTKVTYDPKTDYKLLIREAVAAGDFAAAARYEQQRNEKIRAEGLTKYKQTQQYAAYLPENRYAFRPGDDADYLAAKADMDAAFRALTEGGSFTYDPERDPVYRAYAARYLRQGRDAMEDTLGRASALTGGYGSTYASSAAQQAYEGYLSRLNDVLPDLYGAAWKRHREQQADAATRYGYARAAADKAYERAYGRWEEQLRLSREDEQTTAARYAEQNRAAAEAAAAAEADAQAKAQQQAELARRDAETAKKDADAARKDRQSRKDTLGQMIFKTGYRPTDAELAAVGMTRAEAEAWRQAYYRSLW